MKEPTMPAATAQRTIVDASHILLASDGRAPAREADALLARIADPARVTVTVLGVSSFALALSEGRATVGHHDPTAAHRYVTTAVTDAVSRLRDAGVDARPMVEHDDPATRILETAESQDVDLIALGARPWGLPGPAAVLDRFAPEPTYTTSTEAGAGATATLFDSVSTSVLHHARVPVLIVHGQARDGHGRVRVLVGADGSPASLAAVRALAGVADRERIDVTVLAAIDVDPTVAVRRSGTAGPLLAIGSRIAAVDAAVAERVRDDGHDTARTAADTTADALRDHGFRVRTALVRGRPDEVLLERARTKLYDLVVVGSRGLGALQRVLLGSVSEPLVHHAPATLVAHDPTGR
jgi:nucleotide-binding universal stress UspA family protein